MPGRFELTSTPAKIWHAPDHFRLPTRCLRCTAGELSLASCWLLSVFCFPPMIAKARRPPAVKRT